MEQRANFTGMYFRQFVASFALALSALLLIPARLHAQDPGLLTGTVQMQDRRPIQNARLKVMGTDLIAESREDGSFRLWGIPPGHHTLEVRMLGYSTSLLPFDVTPGGALVLPVTLIAIPVVLDTVRVSSVEMSPWLRGFHERRAGGSGQFFTRQDISKMGARSLTEVMRRATGVRIQPVTTGDAVRSQRTAGFSGSRPCPMLFFLNGTPFPLGQDATINSFVSPEDVEGIEVYSGSSEIPPQFNLSMYNARCGVVAIWMRTGIEQPRLR